MQSEFLTDLLKKLPNTITSSQVFNLSAGREKFNESQRVYLNPLSENHILETFEKAQIDESQLQEFLYFVYLYPQIQVQTVRDLEGCETVLEENKRRLIFSEIVHNHLDRIHELIKSGDYESTLENKTPCRKAVLKLRSCLGGIENLNRLENFMLTVDLNKFSKDDIVSIFNLATAIKLSQTCELELPTFITEISDSDLNETTSRPEPVFLR